MTAAVASLDYLLRQPNALLAGTDMPKPCDRLYVPLTYVQHLADLPREEFSRMPGRQTLLNNFATLLAQTDCDVSQPVFDTPNGLHIRLIKPEELKDAKIWEAGEDPTNPNAQAIAAARKFTLNYPNIPILTYDSGVRALAALSNIPTLQPDLTPPYSGRRTVHLSDDALARLVDVGHHPVALTTWEQHINPSAPLLRPNEFIEITNPPPLKPAPDLSEQTSEADPEAPPPEANPEVVKIQPFPAFRRFDSSAGTVIPLKYQTFAHPKCAEIRPRTAGQRFLLEALLAPADEIPVVIIQGEFGTGKTFLSIAAAYDGVLTKRYSSIVVCPRDSRLGDDIGALPGDTAEKTRNKALGFIDNLYQVVKITEKIPVTPKAPSTTKGKMEEFIRERVQFVPLVEMGGRSLTERFIIYDEFQDMTPSQARALITRLGDRSKMVVMGDLSQVNNPRLSRAHNGLAYLIDRLAGKSTGVAVINLEPSEIVRHPLLCQIASFL